MQVELTNLDPARLLFCLRDDHVHREAARFNITVVVVTSDPEYAQFVEQPPAPISLNYKDNDFVGVQLGEWITSRQEGILVRRDENAEEVM